MSLSIDDSWPTPSGNQLRLAAEAKAALSEFPGQLIDAWLGLICGRPDGRREGQKRSRSSMAGDVSSPGPREGREANERGSVLALGIRFLPAYMDALEAAVTRSDLDTLDFALDTQASKNVSGVIPLLWQTLEDVEVQLSRFQVDITEYSLILLPVPLPRGWIVCSIDKYAGRAVIIHWTDSQGEEVEYIKEVRRSGGPPFHLAQSLTKRLRALPPSLSPICDHR